MKTYWPQRFLIYSAATESRLEQRGRSAVVQGVAFARFSALLILYVATTWHGSHGLDALALVTALAFVTWLISRTRYYPWAVVLIVLDPIFGVPHFVSASHGSIYVLISAPIWMSSGPFVSSLVFRPAITALFVAATSISFAVIWAGVPAEYHMAVASQFLAILCTSALALIGNVIRERNAREIQSERAKVLHSSKLASLGEMAAGVAHELNSPLAAVMLNLEVLRERVRLGQPNSEAMEARFESALQVVERMGQIIKGLRTFARDANEEPFVVGPAQSWIDDTLNLCRERFANNGVELRLSLTGAAQITKVQPVQVSQALLSLLSNAFDAVGALPERWVDLTIRNHPRDFEIVVTDSGSGIPEETVAKMFQPFFTTKDYGQGTGLGLSTARGIMQKQSGELEYEPGARTIFVLRVPKHVA